MIAKQKLCPLESRMLRRWLAKAKIEMKIIAIEDTGMESKLVNGNLIGIQRV